MDVKRGIMVLKRVKVVSKNGYVGCIPALAGVLSGYFRCEGNDSAARALPTSRFAEGFC
jgi:hypothetical protein